MTRKRTVVVATAVSALLLSASAAFAFSSGLFGAHRAEEVGTFQAIEQRLTPATKATSTTSSRDPESTAASATSPRTAGDDSAPAQGSSPGTAVPTSLEPATPAGTVERPEKSVDEASTTSTSTPRPNDHLGDDGHRSDD